MREIRFFAVLMLLTAALIYAAYVPSRDRNSALEDAGRQVDSAAAALHNNDTPELQAAYASAYAHYQLIYADWHRHSWTHDGPGQMLNFSPHTGK